MEDISTLNLDTVIENCNDNKHCITCVCYKIPVEISITSLIKTEMAGI